jgi:hypothetical protein
MLVLTTVNLLAAHLSQIPILAPQKVKSDRKIQEQSSMFHHSDMHPVCFLDPFRDSKVFQNTSDSPWMETSLQD